MNDEQIIKQRLLCDGDGTGEDRRLNMLLKQFLKWVHSKNDSHSANQMMYDRLLAQFAQCNFAASKNVYTVKMINEESENYKILARKHQSSIEIAKKEIDSSKNELLLTKEIRRNKMEYDLLASLINEQPDRNETEIEIKKIKQDIDHLTQKKLKLNLKFQKRRNDFTLLMYSIHEMQKQLEVSFLHSSSSESDQNSDLQEHNGVMEVSDEDDDFGSSRKQTVASYSTKELPLLPLQIKERMSIEEDAVLELSYDKDEK